MASFSIVLVHGYTGRSDDLTPLAQVLAEEHGKDAVQVVALPDHGGDRVPPFDAGRFEKAIGDRVAALGHSGRRLVLLGHSTGGCLILGCLLKADIAPALVVLAATPAYIEGSDLTRWERNRDGRGAVSLTDTARMVAYINRVGKAVQPKVFPLLVLQGGRDDLVAPVHANAWLGGLLGGSARSVTIPPAGHDLFTGPGSAAAVDCVARALADLGRRSGSEERAAIDAIQAMEPDAARFMGGARPRTAHLVRCPASSRAMDRTVDFDAVAATDPVQMNVEITSRCNLGCGHCARALQPRPGQDMTADAFGHLLDLLPNTYKVILVGLGEPTLHPQVAHLVSLAARRGHRVGMVTNATVLDRELARQLIDAGLRSMTFSLDSADPRLAARVRPGMDLDRIVRNIKAFTDLAAGRIPTAVFTAVSSLNVLHLPDLAEAVTGLGVDAWMLTDLNFAANQSISIRRQDCPEYRQALGRAVTRAFSLRLPVLSVRGLEELGLRQRYRDFVLTAPAALGRRSDTHRWCLSPWQTLPVDVAGNVTICDCRPRAVAGNLFQEAFSRIWNGAVMQNHRRAMRSAAPPEACRICPRF